MFYKKRIEELEYIMYQQDIVRLKNITAYIKDRTMKFGKEKHIFTTNKEYTVFYCNNFRIAKNKKDYHLVYNDNYIYCSNLFKKELYNSLEK